MVSFGVIAPAIAALFDFATAVRGAFPESHIAMRIIRAFGLALWLAVLNTLLSIASGVVALGIVTLQTGVPLIFRGASAP